MSYNRPERPYMSGPPVIPGPHYGGGWYGGPRLPSGNVQHGGGRAEGPGYPNVSNSFPQSCPAMSGPPPYWPPGHQRGPAPGPPPHMPSFPPMRPPPGPPPHPLPGSLSHPPPGTPTHPPPGPLLQPPPGPPPGSLSHPPPGPPPHPPPGPPPGAPLSHPPTGPPFRPPSGFPPSGVPPSGLPPSGPPPPHVPPPSGFSPSGLPPSGPTPSGIPLTGPPAPPSGLPPCVPPPQSVPPPSRPPPSPGPGSGSTGISTSIPCVPPAGLSSHSSPHGPPPSPHTGTPSPRGLPTPGQYPWGSRQVSPWQRPPPPSVQPAAAYGRPPPPSGQRPPPTANHPPGRGHQGPHVSSNPSSQSYPHFQGDPPYPQPSVARDSKLDKRETPSWTPAKEEFGASQSWETKNPTQSGTDPETMNDREKDAEWLRTWIQNKCVAKKPTRRKHQSHITVSSGRQLMREALTLNQQLKKIAAKLREGSACSEDPHVVSKAKERLQQIKEILTKDDNISYLQRRTLDLKKKRARHRRQLEERSRMWQEAEERKRHLHVAIDNWQRALLQKAEDTKREAEMKAAADQTLSEVRRKLSEADKAVQLLKATRKLRQIRKDSATKKGSYTSSEADRMFEERLGAMMTMWQKQLQTYQKEKRALEVMMEIEQEETKEKERALKKITDKEKLKKWERNVEKSLFGQSVAAFAREADPLYQYYTAAESSPDLLVRIRRDWDMYSVPEGVQGGSRLPAGWVTPSTPSSEAWASALKTPGVHKVSRD